MSKLKRKRQWFSKGWNKGQKCSISICKTGNSQEKILFRLILWWLPTQIQISVSATFYTNICLVQPGNLPALWCPTCNWPRSAVVWCCWTRPGRTRSHLQVEHCVLTEHSRQGKDLSCLVQQILDGAAVTMLWLMSAAGASRLCAEQQQHSYVHWLTICRKEHKVPCKV